MFTLIATALAALAIATGGITHPPFIRGYQNDSHIVINDTFIGREWECRGKNNDETCYAGLDLLDMLLVTGP